MRAFVTAAVPMLGLRLGGVADPRWNPRSRRGGRRQANGSDDLLDATARTRLHRCRHPGGFVVYQVAADRPRVRKRTPTWARWSEPHGAWLHSYHQARIRTTEENSPRGRVVAASGGAGAGQRPHQTQLGALRIQARALGRGIGGLSPRRPAGSRLSRSAIPLGRCLPPLADAPQRWTTLPAERRQDLRDLISQARGHRTLDPIALLGRPPRLDPDELNDDRIKQDFWALATNQWRVMKQSLRSHSLILHPSRPGVAASRPLFLSRLHWANRDPPWPSWPRVCCRAGGGVGRSADASRLASVAVHHDSLAVVGPEEASLGALQPGLPRTPSSSIRNRDKNATYVGWCGSSTGSVAGKKAPADDLDDLVRLCWTDPDLARLRLEPSQQSEFTKWLRRFSPVPESPANPRAELDRVYTSWGKWPWSRLTEPAPGADDGPASSGGPMTNCWGGARTSGRCGTLCVRGPSGKSESTMTDLHTLAGLVHQPQPESTARVAAQRLRLGGIADPADCLDRLSTAAQELDDFARGKSYEWTHHRHRVTNALLDANAPTGATDWARDSDRAWTFLHNWAWDPCAVVDPEHLESIVEV